MADFASMLRYLREREGLSQKELAAKLRMSPSAICMYEAGNRHPKPEDEETIADFFNVDLNTLRGRRTYEGELDYAQVAKAMSLYNVYLQASPEVRRSIDILLQAAQQVSQTVRDAQLPTMEIENPRSVPYLKAESEKPRAEVPHLNSDKK